MESSKEETTVSYGKDKKGKPIDGFDYFLKRGSFPAGREGVRFANAAHVEAVSRSPCV